MTSPRISLGRLARHDARLLSADRTLLGTLGLLLASAAFALLSGYGWVQALRTEGATADASYFRRIATLERMAAGDPGGPDAEKVGSARNAMMVGNEMRDLVLPPGPLAALAVGDSDILPGRAGVSLWATTRSLVRNHEVANPLNLLVGRFDLAFVIVYLLPLFALVLSFDIVSSERERGTLALVLSQPTTLGRFVAGKVVLRASLIVLPALLATLAGAAMSGGLAASGGWVRLGVWAAVVTGYGLFWFALGVLVNTLGLRSATNAIALACLWLLLVLVLPAGLNLVATSVHPPPSRIERIQAARVAANDAERRGAQVLGKFLHDHPELRPEGKFSQIGEMAATYFAVQRQIDEHEAPVLRQHDEAVARQRAFVRRLQWITPAVLVQETLNALAGTDHARHARFVDEARRFLREYQSYFLGRLFREQPLAQADFDSLPRFTFQEEPLGDVVTRAAPGAVALLFVGALALAAGLSQLSRTRSGAGPLRLAGDRPTLSRTRT